MGPEVCATAPAATAATSPAAKTVNLRPLLQGWRDCLLLAMCGAWLLALVWIGHPENDLLKALWSQTMAAWVQAVGSIIAIGLAIWLADRQATSAREAAAEAERQLEIREMSGLSVCLQGAAEAARVFAWRTDKGAWKDGNVDYLVRIIQRILGQLSAIHLRNLPTDDAREDAIRASMALETFMTTLAVIRAELPVQPARTALRETGRDIEKLADKVRDDLAVARLRH